MSETVEKISVASSGGERHGSRFQEGSGSPALMLPSIYEIFSKFC